MYSIEKEQLTAYLGMPVIVRANVAVPCTTVIAFWLRTLLARLSRD
jgi:hypothetical protein